jgi:beta-N-acetylhexosaminidase
MSAPPASPPHHHRLRRGLQERLHLRGESGSFPPHGLSAIGDPELTYQVGWPSRTALGDRREQMYSGLRRQHQPQEPEIGGRSFGDDPRSVRSTWRRIVRGYQEGGIAATAKHFPAAAIGDGRPRRARSRERGP